MGADSDKGARTGSCLNIVIYAGMEYFRVNELFVSTF